MSNWGQPHQPGYQYPIQTGFPASNQQFHQQNPQFNPQQQPQFQQGNPQFQPAGNFGAGALAPQPTGFAGAQLGAFQQRQQQQPQQSFPTGQGFLQAQPTGFPGQAANFQQRAAPPPPPVPPIPSQFHQQNAASGFLNPQQPQQQLQQPPQINRFLAASPGIGGGGLQPQPTGFPGRPMGGGLVPQMTGYVDPRLQMMTTTFMPAANTQFGATPQLAQPQFNLQQSIQQHNQTNRGSTTQHMSWALTKQEKKQYNDIFRSWDAQNTGFINGQNALEVFGASGLPKDDLAKIWSLADVNDRGKLNIAEFHVAMGLIYRKLSGNPIPDTLPNELIPPSARDLDDSVDQIKNLLANETRNSPSNLDEPISRLKARSFNSSQSSLDSGRDATIYKHSDADEPAGGFYKPRSRHVNRDDVRSRVDEDNPNADLADMKRRLASTANMLDRAAERESSRTAEDEELDREMDEMKYRVKRVSEDLEYVSRSGPRTPARDAERRKLERELMELTHEKIPVLERKLKAREERKEREKRDWARERDRANDKFGRFDARDDRDRPYSRGSGYDRDRDYRDDRGPSRRSPSRDRDRDRDYGRDGRRDYERPRSPPRARSPPPPPPAAEPPSSIRDRPAPPKPSASPAPAAKNMTPEERKAFARAEAQRRINARMAALGVTAPSANEASSPVIDVTVEDRLAQEKKEAEEKARIAEKQAEERERARKERLEGEKAAKEGRAVTPSPVSPKPLAVAPPPPKPAAAPVKVAPVAPKRAPAPPPPRRSVAPPPPVQRTAVLAPPAKPTPPPAPVQPEIDPEEEAIRAKEEALRKQREARAERLRQLEREEQEAAEAERLEEERYRERLKALRAKSSPKPPTPPPAEPAKAPSPPPAPVAPPVPPVVPAIDTKSTNPFSRLIGKDVGATPVAAPTSTPAGNGSSNPWARPAQTPSPALPSAGPKSYNVASNLGDDDDWDDIKENLDDDDSSDEDDSRDKRKDIAAKLFGGILPSAAAPTSRPSSAAPGQTGSTPKSPVGGPMSAPPSAPSAPFAPPPPPPPAPAAPFTPAISSGAPAAGDGRGALMTSIQGGLKLRPAKTVDKSGPPGVGKVLGDAAPPSHINTVTRPPSPPAPREVLPEPTPMAQESNSASSSLSSNRQSVGWFTERAADAGKEMERLPSTTEEEDEDEDDYVKAEPPSAVPSIMVESFGSEFSSSTAATAAPDAPDPLADIDKSVEHLTRSLYPFEGDGPDDLSFGENLVLKAHPSKTGGDWWYGTLVNTGKSGLFPKTYVEPFTPSKAKAVYSYTGNNPDELPFMEGDELTIIDKSDGEWWKAEQGGVVFIVPAAYLEAVEG